MKRGLIIGIVVIVIIVIALGIYVTFYSWEAIPPTQVSGNCPERYVSTELPYLVPEGTETTYCKIDKEWEDFESCTDTNICLDEFSCIAKDDGILDFRCIPDNDYKMACGCSRESVDSEVVCWCT
ncbi:hypothetical protein CMI46_02855 [Candidatus Pacearchaeota archaeon]|nr:hypothetical protein [Candidatus Pacearchaeota archaeon]|tara:strand:+ start:79 stop:453 length:375 start_codon:yes stop_codon:yes gene_type:complete